MKVQQKLALILMRKKVLLLWRLNKKFAIENLFNFFCTPFIRPNKKIPPFFKKAELIEFDFNGLMVRGYRFQAKGTKKILILHGFSSSCTNFQGYIQPLLKKGYCVLAFDAPAHGRSEGKTINSKVYGDMIERIEQDFGQVDGFVAHSLGGLAVCLALENMKHQAAKKVVLIAPATETDTAIDQLFRFLKINNRLLRDAFEKFIIEISGKPITWFSISRSVKHIKASILWIHDRDDDITPYSDVLPVQNDKHPNIQFIVTDGLGHRKIYHDKTVIKKAVDFL